MTRDDYAIATVTDLSKPTTASLAEEARRKFERKSALAADTRPLAGRTATELCLRLPDVDPAVIGAVLMHAASYIGTEILAMLDEDGIDLDYQLRQDQYVLMTANAMVMAGEQLHTAGQQAAPDRRNGDGR